MTIVDDLTLETTIRNLLIEQSIMQSLWLVVVARPQRLVATWKPYLTTHSTDTAAVKKVCVYSHTFKKTSHFLCTYHVSEDTIELFYDFFHKVVPNISPSVPMMPIFQFLIC